MRIPLAVYTPWCLLYPPALSRVCLSSQIKADPGLNPGTSYFAKPPLCSGARLPSQVVDPDVHRSRNAARQKHQHACLHYPLANDGSRPAAAALFAEKFYRRSIYWQSSEMDDSASGLITNVYALAESAAVAPARDRRTKGGPCKLS